MRTLLRTNVRKMTSSDAHTVARVLAEAFYDDPLMCWMVPRDARRSRRLEHLFALASRRIWMPQGECYVPERVIGAAMWMPPETWKLSPVAQLAMLPASARALGGDLARMMKLDASLRSRTRRSPPTGT
jgi:hypothetical protein